MQKIAILFILLLGVLPITSALSCITMAGDYDLNTQKDKINYFSFRIYNSTADPNSTCDPGKYGIKLSLKDQEIDDFFKYKISENNFVLQNGDSKQILIDITPKIDSGYFEILVTGLRSDLGVDEISSKIVNSVTGKIKINVGDGAQTKNKFETKPEWVQAQDAELEKIEQDKKDARDKWLKDNWIYLAFSGIIIILIIVIIVLFSKTRNQRNSRW